MRRRGRRPQAPRGALGIPMALHANARARKHPRKMAGGRHLVDLATMQDHVKGAHLRAPCHGRSPQRAPVVLCPRLCAIRKRRRVTSQARTRSAYAGGRGCFRVAKPEALGHPLKSPRRPLPLLLSLSLSFSLSLWRASLPPSLPPSPSLALSLSPALSLFLPPSLSLLLSLCRRAGLPQCVRCLRVSARLAGIRPRRRREGSCAGPRPCRARRPSRPAAAGG